MIFLSYKYRLKDKRTAKRLARLACAVNFVWNYCVETQKKVYRNFQQGCTSPWLSQYNLQSMTKETSKELGIHAQSVQSTCEQFVKSRDHHKKCPRFRASSGPRRSLGWIPFQKQSRQIEDNSIWYLGKRYRFFGSKKHPLPKNVKGGCFVEDSLGRWWACFHVEVLDNLQKGFGEIGIDLGLKTLATTSAGDKIENPASYRKLEDKLSVAQRAGNKRRAKAIHAKISNIRRDYLHKASAKLTRENGFIVIGNVNAEKLAKTHMAKSVLDAGWSMFRNMLRYKASRHGASYVEVDERFTTQTCSSCGSLPPERPKGIAGLGIREWVCSVCGASHDRDVNAAKNILMLGLSAQPRVDESRRIV